MLGSWNIALYQLRECFCLCVRSQTLSPWWCVAVFVLFLCLSLASRALASVTSQFEHSAKDLPAYPRSQDGFYHWPRSAFEQKIIKVFSGFYPRVEMSLNKMTTQFGVFHQDKRFHSCRRAGTCARSSIKHSQHGSHWGFSPSMHQSCALLWVVRARLHPYMTGKALWLVSRVEISALSATLHEYFDFKEKFWPWRHLNFCQVASLQFFKAEFCLI